MTTTTSTDPLSLTEVRALVQDIIGRYGAGHTAGCVYYRDGLPVCLVGQVFAQIGVERPLEGCTVVEQRPEILSLFDEEALEFLQEVQIEQDAGHPWGEAVRIAENYLKESQ